MEIFGESHARKEDELIINRLLKTIENLLKIIENLTSCPQHGVPKLHLVFYQLTNKSISMATNSATLTDLLKHTFVAQAVDTNGNTYGGTLAFTSVTPTDATQDLGSADPTVANTVDVQAETNTGGTVVNVVGNLTSDGTSVPAAGQTPIAVTAGQVIPVAGVLTLINNVSTTPPPPPTGLGLQFTQAT
jgi:hypothetical protein